MRAALTLAAVLAASAIEAAPNIDHVGLDCIEPGRFAVVLSGIDPGDQIQTAKVYFRSSLYRDFYYVEMTKEGASFVGILPQPLPETPRIIYYVEAVDHGFASTRSLEFDPPVKRPCKDRNGLAYLPSDPGITVGAVSAAASPLPPGFSAVGIVGTITALGVSSGVGGGIGVGAGVAIAAGAAAGVTGAVVVTQGGETTSGTTTVAVTTSVFSSPPATTTSSPTSSAPGSTTTSLPSTTTTSTPTTTTAPSTTSAPGSSTTTSVPPTTTTSTPTTSSSSTTTTAAAPPVAACFTATKLNSCVWRFDATCSSGPIIKYDWLIDPAGTLPAPRPPVNETGQVVTVDWNPPTYGGCSNSPTISVQLTVTGSLGQTDAKGQSVTIDLSAVGARRDLRTSVTSFLGIPPFDGTSHGFLVLNDSRTDATSNATPHHHVFGGVAGRNTIEGYTDAPETPESFWRFDFSGAAHVVPGSLRVERGLVLSLDARSIVFQLTGTAGDRIRFGFELSP